MAGTPRSVRYAVGARAIHKVTTLERHVPLNDPRLFLAAPIAARLASSLESVADSSAALSLPANQCGCLSFAKWSTAILRYLLSG